MDDLNKRGRKKRRGAPFFHDILGPHEIRLHLLLACHGYPELGRLLNDARVLADSDLLGFETLISNLEQLPLKLVPDHAALRPLFLWAVRTGLIETNWALLLSARVVRYSLYAPVEHRDKPIIWAAWSVAEKIRASQESAELDARVRAAFGAVEPRMMVAGARLKRPRTPDIPPKEVAEWLMWRLVECRNAKTVGKRPPGWEKLAARTSGRDKDTVRKNTLLLAEYLDVPITLLG